MTSREVTLLPRHWQWLENQPNGMSAAIRRLVEHEMKHNAGRERARGIRESLYRILTAMASDRTHFEEATRVFFADDVSRLEILVGRWPRDSGEYAVRSANEALDAERSDTTAGDGGAS